MRARRVVVESLLPKGLPGELALASPPDLPRRSGGRARASRLSPGDLLGPRRVPAFSVSRPSAPCRGTVVPGKCRRGDPLRAVYSRPSAAGETWRLRDPASLRTWSSPRRRSTWIEIARNQRESFARPVEARFFESSSPSLPLLPRSRHQDGSIPCVAATSSRCRWLQVPHQQDRNQSTRPNRDSDARCWKTRSPHAVRRRNGRHAQGPDFQRADARVLHLLRIPGAYRRRVLLPGRRDTFAMHPALGS